MERARQFTYTHQQMTHSLLVPYSYPNELEPLTEGRICLLKVRLIHGYIERVIILGKNTVGPLAIYPKRILDCYMNILWSIWVTHKKMDGCN
jgi:hypothetical protein